MNRKEVENVKRLVEEAQKNYQKIVDEVKLPMSALDALIAGDADLNNALQILSIALEPLCVSCAQFGRCKLSSVSPGMELTDCACYQKRGGRT